MRVLFVAKINEADLKGDVESKEIFDLNRLNFRQYDCSYEETN